MTALADATAIAEAIAAGDLSAVEAVEAAIGRISALNPRLNAVVRERFDHALDEARVPRAGPFAGVPILLKELAPYPGWPSTSASRVLADASDGPKSSLVQAIEDAGFIVIGRTNSAEFGALPITAPDLYGPTDNPWKSGHDCGGSSGGAAAAVASGMVAIAQCGDAGGSIRIPASACGVFGFKPSRGVVQAPPMTDDGFATTNAITRSVRDSAAFLDVIAQRKQPGERYAAVTGTPPPGLRIAIASLGFAGGRPVDPACQTAVMAIGQLLAEMGHNVSVAAPDIDVAAVHDGFLTRGAAQMGDLFNRLEHDGARIEQAGFWPRAMALWGRALDVEAMSSAQSAFVNAERAMAEFLTHYDVLVTPVLSAPPAPHGYFDRFDTLATMREALLDYAPHGPVASACGTPACALPATMHQGLPIGVEISMAREQDAMLLRLAATLEKAAPWGFP